MKRQLLLSTAIVSGAALLLAGPAVAGSAQTGTLDLTIGGSFDFQAGIGDDDVADSASGKINNRGYDFVTDTEIHFTFQGTTDNGLTFGARVELEVDTNASGGNSDEVNGFISGDFGRIEMGDQDGAEHRMIYDAGRTQSGVGGIDGDVDRWFSNTATSKSFPDITDSSDATKLTYFSPRFSGIQAGISFTPDTGSGGTNVGNDDDGHFEEHIGLGINFVETFNGVDVAIGAVAGFGDAETFTRAGATDPGDDIENYAIGANIGYAGFTVGGSYGNNGDTGSTDDSWFFNIGAGYSQGPWSVSVGYLYSEAETDVGSIDSEFRNIAVGGNYKIAPGLKAYADLLLPDSDNDSPTISDNDATILLLGTVVSF